MKKIIAVVIVLLIIWMEGLLASPVMIPDSTGVKKENGKNYIEHKVEMHEGWYGIARQYGISYADLRLANKNEGDTLHIGQVILVPTVKPKITDQRNLKNYMLEEKKEPVMYEVKQKETLYAISKKFKVKTSDLKEWNHLDSGKLKNGDKIIVGYKNVKENSEQVEAKTEANPVVKENKEIKTAEVKAPDAKPDSGHSVAKDDKKLIAVPADNKVSLSKTRKSVFEQGVATWIDDENINPNKYFALHRTAPTGTIIKVTNKMNKRAIFVKVVGKLPDTGDNENIIIKISKASAEKLGVRDQRFQSELSYGITEASK
jgi:LysM repeat protein